MIGNVRLFIGQDKTVPDTVSKTRHHSALSLAWGTIRERAGLPGLRLHDLRHSFASFLVNRNASLYTVQLMLGHSNPRTTQRYAHLSRETLNKAAALVADAVEGVNLVPEPLT